MTQIPVDLSCICTQKVLSLKVSYFRRVRNKAICLNKEVLMLRPRYFVLIALVMFVNSTTSYAQLDNVEDLLRGGVRDAELLVRSYLTPFGNAFGADLNAGWYQTAKTHKFLGFDLTVMASAAIAPVSDETFDLNALGLQNLRLSSPGADPNTPTIVGNDQPGPDVQLVVDNPLTGQEEILANFRMPGGIGFRVIPSPMVQASVGVFMNTDLILRFFPEVQFENDLGRIGMYGIGLKHNLTQWLPGGNLLPFDLAVVLGVTTFRAEANLNVQPDPNAISSGGNYENQQIVLEANSFVINAVISKKLSLLTLFAGVGIESSTVDLNMQGTYPITSIETDPASPNFGQSIVEDFVDPVNLSFDGANTTRADVGFRLNFVLLSVYGSYTLAKYPVAHVGAAFSIR